MPLENWVHHSALWPFLYDWQTLLAGLLALGAALWTISVTRSAANSQIEAANQQVAAARAQIATDVRLDRERAQNERGDESVAAAVEMQAAIHRCMSAIEDKRQKEIWKTYTAAWDSQTKFRAAYAVARRYHSNLSAGGPPVEVDVLLYRLRGVARAVDDGLAPDMEELNGIAKDLRTIVERFGSQMGHVAS
jgi:hypothetical protein